MSPLASALVLILAGVALATTSDWQNYKMEHSKVYTGEEDETRHQIWQKNVKMVAKHNSEKHSYIMAINRFSDWTEEEFSAFLGYRPLGDKSNVKIFENVKTPDSVDFRDENKVTPVKDQKQCGSCWAFSATGGIEGVWAKNMGELVSVSEQQLVDCAKGGCNGGIMSNAWTDVAERGGIMSEEDYPYQASDGRCYFQDDKVVSHISGYERVSSDENQMEQALIQIGYPISVGVHAAFGHYHSGVFDDNHCKDGEVNHAVLVVGYDKTGSEPYWIVKNSWGRSWGDHGYIKMKMGINVCGIELIPCYPTM